MLKVAVITVTTRDREVFNERIKKIFKSQDYPNKQHIIIEGDGSIGMKKNKAIEATSADIIICFDSDDIFAPDYISKCVEQLKTCDTTGLNAAYFYHEKTQRAWLWEYQTGASYVIGSGAAFWRRVWQFNKFADTSEGEDRLFMKAAGKVAPHGYLNGFVANIHDNNTASHKSLHLMHEIDVNYLKKVVNFTL